MTGPHVVSQLSKKYAKLLGEYEFAERMTEDATGLDAIIEATNRCDERKMEIDEKLAAIETVIWLFDPKWDPATIRPNYPKARFDKPGEISKAAFSILRETTKPMTSREIAKEVAAKLGYGDIEGRDVTRLDNAVHIALSTRLGRTVEIVSHKPRRWSLIPRKKIARERQITAESGPLRLPGLRARSTTRSVE